MTKQNELELFHALVRADDLLAAAAQIVAGTGVPNAVEQIEGIRVRMAHSMSQVQDRAYARIAPPVAAARPRRPAVRAAAR